MSDNPRESMVKRVALAICAVAEKGFDPELEPKLWMYYEAHARAALAATREPTREMIEAGSWEESTYARWRAMIDAALKE